MKDYKVPAREYREGYRDGWRDASSDRNRPKGIWIRDSVKGSTYRRCPNCGCEYEKLKPNKFCSNCGTRLKEGEKRKW